jgi:DNA polymerase alpha subunit A
MALNCPVADCIPAKRKREEDADRQEKLNSGISKYFNQKPAGAALKAKPVRTAEDDDFMASLLGEVNTNIQSRTPTYGKQMRSNDRRKTRVLSPALDDQEREHRRASRHTNANNTLSTTPPVSNRLQDDDDDNMYLTVPQDDDVPMSDPLPSSPAARAVERKAKAAIKLEEVEEDDMMEVAEVTGHSTLKHANVNIKGSRPVARHTKIALPTPISSSPVAAGDGPDIAAISKVTDRLNLVSSPAPQTASAGKLSASDALEDDGTLRFFWTDYTEVRGELCLFGKVKNRKNDSFVSCFVKVNNILRKLYFLPREHRHRNGRDTSEEVEMGDVYEEVNTLMDRFKVSMHKTKPCTRKYAFELPGVPKEAEYLKLLYPYDKPVLPMDVRGETFSHVFGTNTSLFEQFVLWKNIMGPCWLTIQDGDFNAVNNASWCKLELAVNKPNDITVLAETEATDTPPMTLMSLVLKTTFNEKENKNEILVASIRVFEDVSLSDTTPPDRLPNHTHTIMRPYGEYPVGFKLLADKHNGSIRMEKSEAALLSFLLAMIQRYDPDALVGHKLDDVDFNVLLSRMRDRKTPGWHRIGRLKRADWPKNVGKGGSSFYVERQLVAGRLLCDIANDMGKSIMQGCQSWSLDEMVKLFLPDAHTRREIDIEKQLAMASTKEGLMGVVKLCEADTYYIASIALRKQLLPLTKILTNLAGNSWARTLSGTRAERNEYILLHEFHRNKYINPDKIFGKGPTNQKLDDNAEGEGEEGANTKKKDKFKGGLVFEPEKGLYDKFILVMDFNSLYPSIIQEFNICFTTVERGHLTEEDEKVPDVPEDTANKGILPRLIRTLVSRRREVKKLMKDKSASEEQRATWDVKQQALKLTANSMYGCLGYTKSRFYARPLAALTTSKGREILQSTKDLAESTHALRVIYGDTDSVMVNTNVDNVLEAIQMGKEFQKSVNERYELLEIEIDHVFRRLLLHAKKKYAAIQMVENNGVWESKLDVKGLDMRRREYCQLSKDVSGLVLV